MSAQDETERWEDRGKFLMDLWNADITSTKTYKAIPSPLFPTKQGETMLRIRARPLTLFIKYVLALLLAGVTSNPGCRNQAESLQVEPYVKDLRVYSVDPPYSNHRYLKAVYSLARRWSVKHGPTTYAIASPNLEYVLFVTGAYCEWGLYGPTTYTLTDNTGNKLWEKTFLHGGMPAISNTGYVAIFGDTDLEDEEPDWKAIIIDQEGTMTGSYVPHDDQLPNDEFWDFQMHYFSPDNKRYYLCTSKYSEAGFDLFLRCLDLTGKEMWEKCLRNYEATSVLFSNDGSRVILDDFGISSTDFINRCYVFSDSGDEIVRVNVDVRGPYYPPFLDPQTGDLIAYDENTQEISRYDILTGELLGHLTLQDILEYLEIPDRRTRATCLYILAYGEGSFSISQKTRRILKDIANSKDSDLNRNAKRVLNKAKSR